MLPTSVGRAPVEDEAVFSDVMASVDACPFMGTTVDVDDDEEAVESFVGGSAIETSGPALLVEGTL
jgi:hypothetical protein